MQGDPASPFVISIWHTGTRSTLAYFGLQQLSAHYCHITPEFNSMYAYKYAAEHECCIIPLRDPVSVWQSWEKRSYRKWGRPNEGSNTPAWFQKVWQVAACVLKGSNAMILPVDHPLRGEYIADILDRWPHLSPALDEFPTIKDNDKPVEYNYLSLDFESIYKALSDMGVHYQMRSHAQAQPI